MIAPAIHLGVCNSVLSAICSCRRCVALGLCYGCLFIIILEGVFGFLDLGTTAMFLPMEDDSFSAPITVPGSIPAFGEDYSTLYVSINPQHLHTCLVGILWKSDFMIYGERGCIISKMTYPRNKSQHLLYIALDVHM